MVKQLLQKHGYVTRKAQKSKAMGQHPDRNQQFENIARLKQEYLESDNPIVSMDTKKKELIGNFYRDGPPPDAGGHRDVRPRLPQLRLGRGHPPRALRREAQRRPCEPGDQPRHRRVRLRQHRAVVGGAGACALPPGDLDPAAVRRRWQQQCQPVPVQGGPAAAGRIGSGSRSGWRTTRRILLEVQPDRASAVPAPDPSVPGGDLRRAWSW